LQFSATIDFVFLEWIYNEVIPLFFTSSDGWCLLPLESIFYLMVCSSILNTLLFPQRIQHK
jgi:hypothetical protein